MQQENSPAHGCNNGSTILSQPGDRAGFTSLYSSIFSPRPSFSTSVSVTPSDEYSGDEDGNANSSPLFDLAFSPHSRLVLEHRDLLERHNLCLSHLHDTAKEAEALRLENTNLRLANRDLCKRLSLLIQASLQTNAVPPDYSSMSVVDGFRKLCVGDTDASGSNSRAWDEVNDESPTSVIESDRIEGMGVERVSLPKSISVRSSGYLKTTQAAGVGNAASNRNPPRPRSASPVSGTHKVYVNGGRNPEESPLEMEVFNQGMFKTELCNKWQETGACPYGEHCQFAHGIKELRPVIRHPRYKTEVCRMVLAGDSCPYGHRCHFRHALTDEEKLIARPIRRRT